MGFSQGKLLSGKAVFEPAPTPGWSAFAGRKVALEGHALQYSTVSQLDGVYKNSLSQHIFDEMPIPQGTFDFICDRHARQVVKQLHEVDGT
jgi:hypothetical protein